jgi:hypothetical protein
VLVQEGLLGTHVMSSEQGAILRPQERPRSEAVARPSVRAVRVRRRGRNILAVELGLCDGGKGFLEFEDFFGGSGDVRVDVRQVRQLKIFVVQKSSGSRPLLIFFQSIKNTRSRDN